jgi:cell division protein FtsB
MSKAHLGFQVRQHNPLRLWLGLALILLLLVVMFLFGRAYQSYELNQLKLVEETLESRIAELENRNDSLVKKNAQLTSASSIEHDAYEKANESLVSLEKEILALQEQLVFYQGIVSPEELALGINIQSIELNKKNDQGLYSYKLVLTKRGKSSAYIKGTIGIHVKGQAEGEQKKLAMQKVKQDYSEKDTKFSFRYFQVFEGELMLPEGFEPYDIELEVSPVTKKIKNFSETISWAEALSGGNN